jgi:hypothetical protein
MSSVRRHALHSVIASLIALSACAGDDAVEPDAQGGGPADAGADAGDGATNDVADGSTSPPLSALGQAAIDIGLAEFLGQLPAPTLESSDADSQTWAWTVDDGPLCMRGGAFRYTTRTLDPERLVIFLQGGGACWDEFCLAVNQAPAGIPAVDALRRDLDVNPLRDWSIAYLPYCDGSLFAGNRDHDDDGDGTPDDQEAADADNDGTDDAADTDDDNDGTPDAKDNDDDGDGTPDDQEAADADHDGTADNADTDDDNDGIADAQGSDDEANTPVDQDGDDGADDTSDTNADDSGTSDDEAPADDDAHGGGDSDNSDDGSDQE